MPHILIDYSKGAAERIDMHSLAQAVHRAMRDSGFVSPNAVRTFAREATISCVADEDDANHFIQIIVRIAPGRPADLRKSILETIFAAAAGVARPGLDEGRIGLRVDLTQSDPDFAKQENRLP